MRPRDLHLKQVTVIDRPYWRKWPHTADRDYSGVLDIRRSIRYGKHVYVEERYYPVYYPYVAVGGVCPEGIGVVDNTRQPPEAVASRMREDLLALSKECDVLHWHSVLECYPSVMEALRGAFRLSFFSFADDCPGSSETRSFVVAGYFDAAIHSMRTWSVETKELVADKYRALGVKRTYCALSQITHGLLAGARDLGFQPEQRAALVESGADLDYDLVFIGQPCWGSWRHTFLTKLADLRRRSPLRVGLFGAGMPDGELAPRNHPEGPGYPCADVYLRSRMGLNVQLSGLYNTRLMDCWMLGVPQLIWDPCGDMAAIGALPGVHYIPFDGTPEGLLAACGDWSKRGKDLRAIVRSGYAKQRECSARLIFPDTLERVYLDAFGDGS